MVSCNIVMKKNKLILYNTLGRRYQEFKSVKRGKVGIYTCGPTVYWYQHIGNLRSYIFADILKRVLLYNGYEVKHVMNVTDVGHLTSDADTGEDKIEKAAKQEGRSAREIANFYWQVFKEDFKKLNILEPQIWCKATEHVNDMIEFIQVIEKKGYTYKTNDGIYFDTSKLRDYGKLAGLRKEKLRAGIRINLREKKNITDFALWKFSEKPGIRQQEWSSPWGIGFPGWHIECSVMSLKYLASAGKFDIHTGGEDHIAVHHTNEMAQNFAYLGHYAVNFWMHGAFLKFAGKKISKSKGGLYTISQLEEKGFLTLAYRYFCLTTHYRKPLNFDLKKLKTAQESYRRLKNIISNLKDDKKVNQSYLKEFEKAINFDLNMPEALQVLWKLLRDEKATGKIRTIEKMDSVLALDLLKQEKEDIPTEIKELVTAREEARKQKDWKKADELRRKIRQRGWWIDDTPEGPRVRRI
jgi:cysteinyl-tRNA synthetase